MVRGYEAERGERRATLPLPPRAQLTVSSSAPLQRCSKRLRGCEWRPSRPTRLTHRAAGAAVDEKAQAAPRINTLSKGLLITKGALTWNTRTNVIYQNGGLDSEFGSFDFYRTQE